MENSLGLSAVAVGLNLSVSCGSFSYRFGVLSAFMLNVDVSRRQKRRLPIRCLLMSISCSRGFNLNIFHCLDSVHYSLDFIDNMTYVDYKHRFLYKNLRFITNSGANFEMSVWRQAQFLNSF